MEENTNGKTLFSQLKPSTQDFVKIAYNALQAAYRAETGQYADPKNEKANAVGELLQTVGDFTRN